MKGTQQSVELADYLRVIRARKWLIVKVTVVVTAAVLVFSLFATKYYAATAEVLMRQQDTGSAILGTNESGQSSHPERDMATQVRLVKSRGLLLGAIQRLQLQETPEELSSRLDVTVVPDTNVISIKSVDTDPQRAAATANAIAEAFCAQSRDAKRASIKAAADQVQQRLNESKAQILALTKPGPDGQQTPANEGQLQIATAAYTTLAQKLEELRVSQQLESGDASISTVAFADAHAVSPQPLRNTLLGLVVGLIAGVGMALVAEYLDNTVKSDEEAQDLYLSPVLGHIPFVKTNNGNACLPIVDEPGSRAAEAFRGLRNSLDFVNFDGRVKTVMVTSCAPAEGKSTVAANLAASLAVTGVNVVLINTDFRRPTLSRFFGLSNNLGLSDVLLGKSSASAALQPIGDGRLQLLSAGKVPPNPSELLGSQQMEDLVKSLEEWADWIIVDTPPLLAVSDGAAVAKWADAVLVISRIGTTTRTEARRGIDVLARVGTTPVGVVLTEPERPSAAASYGTYYSSYHGYYAQGEGASERHGSEQDRSTGRQSWRRVLAFVAVFAIAAAAASVLLLR